MTAFEPFLKAFVKDVAVKLTDEFDRNFERKAFFDKKWPQTKWHNPRGSLMMRSGTLRRSLKSKVTNSTIHFSSSLPYAALHNEGGTITVTPKMKRFFWAMYYRATNAIIYRVKTKAAANTQRNQKLTTQAATYKALALMKPGSKIKIPQRQVIGYHPQVDGFVQTIADKHLTKWETDIFNQLKNHK